MPRIPLGTRWNGKSIGTIGVAGCFSFQSYKLINGGEGGMLITDDAELFARAVIMSGAYEHNWNTIRAFPIFARNGKTSCRFNNMRMHNLTATVWPRSWARCRVGWPTGWPTTIGSRRF